MVMLIVTVRNETLRLQPPVPSSLQRAPAIGGGGKALGPNMYEPFTSCITAQLTHFCFKGLSQKARLFKFLLMSFIGIHVTSLQTQINSGRRDG